MGGKNESSDRSSPCGCSFFARIPPFRRNPGALALGQQVFFSHQQVAERSQQMKPITIFGKAAVADLAVTENLLDVAERMFDLSSDTRLNLLGLSQEIAERFALAWSTSDEPGDTVPMLMLIPPVNTAVPGVTENALLIAVQQLAGRHDVVDISGCGIDAVNQAQSVINANMHFHAEVPFVALLGLMHFRIALAALVLGGTGGRDNRR